MSYAALTDIGLVRKNNEDSIFAADTAVGSLRNLFIVADGMGGHQGGEIASSFVIKGITSYLKKKRRRREIPALLSEAVDKVNRELYEKAKSDPELEGMGTTLVLATIKNGTLYAVNVGDSRLYLWEEGRLSQITHDHSMVDEMVEAGRLTKDDPFYRANKNVITRAMGAEEIVVEDFFALEPKCGSRVLLCSDGLSGVTPDEEIAGILEQAADPEEAVRELIERSKLHGGADNISAIVIDIDEVLLERGAVC